jgi:hypothetical protein
MRLHIILALVCRGKSGRIRPREMLGDYARASALARFAFWIEVVRNFTADFPYKG